VIKKLLTFWIGSPSQLNDTAPQRQAPFPMLKVVMVLVFEVY